MENYHRNRVLVTGGAGFLGSHLCERLLQEENDLIGPINLGNPVEFTILELAEKVIELTKSKSKIIFEPLPTDDPAQRQPAISIAKNKLKWEPVAPLEEGLRKTIDYFENFLRKDEIL